MNIKEQVQYDTEMYELLLDFALNLRYMGVKILTQEGAVIVVNDYLKTKQNDFTEN